MTKFQAIQTALDNNKKVVWRKNRESFNLHRSSDDFDDRPHGHTIELIAAPKGIGAYTSPDLNLFAKSLLKSMLPLQPNEHHEAEFSNHALRFASSLFCEVIGLEREKIERTVTVFDEAMNEAFEQSGRYTLGEHSQEITRTIVLRFLPDETIANHADHGSPNLFHITERALAEHLKK